MIYKAAYDIWSAFTEFNDQALTFGLAAVIIYSIAVIVINIYNTVKGKASYSVARIIIKLCLFTLFGIYASYAISLTLSGREAGSRSGYVNLIPFTTIITDGKITRFAVENWLLFVPFGILVPMIWKNFRSFFRTGILGFFASILIEIVQLITKRGFLETDDIILNSIGALSGYLIFAYFYEGFLGIRLKILSDIAGKEEKTMPVRPPYDRFIVSHSIALFLLTATPVVLCMNMIMSFSSDTGDASRQWSRPVAYGAAKLISFFGGSAQIPDTYDPSMIIDGENLYLDFVEKVIRKMAHVVEYSLLAIVIWVMIFTIRKLASKYSYIITIAAVAAVGAIDEFNQSGTAGRYGSFVDVIVDTAGAAIVMLIIRAIITKAKAHYCESSSSRCLYL